MLPAIRPSASSLLQKEEARLARLEQERLAREAERRAKQEAERRAAEERKEKIRQQKEALEKVLAPLCHPSPGSATRLHESTAERHNMAGEEWPVTTCVPCSGMHIRLVGPGNLVLYCLVQLLPTSCGRGRGAPT